MSADFAFYSFNNKYFKLLTTKQNQWFRKTLLVYPVVLGYGPHQDIKVLRNKGRSRSGKLTWCTRPFKIWPDYLSLLISCRSLICTSLSPADLNATLTSKARLGSSLLPFRALYTFCLYIISHNCLFLCV